MTDTKISLLGTTDTDALRKKVLTPKGALVTLAANLTTQNFSTPAAIPFTSEIYDTDSIHDNSVNNTRLTVPAGVSWVELIAQVSLALVTSANPAYISVQHFNSAGVQQTAYKYPFSYWSVTTATDPASNIHSPPIAVSAGDYFVLTLYCADTSMTINAAGTWFCMKILG